MPRPLNRFINPQPRLDRRRGRFILPRQSALLDRTADRRKDAGNLYDYRIFRPRKEDVING